MTLTRALARPMLAGIFITGGIDSLRHPEEKAAAAGDVAPGLAAQFGLPDDPVTLVRINGAVQVAGGALLATGRFPRIASLMLAGSLAPTTYAGHRFWELTDDTARRQQQVQFLKNVAIFGGLVLAAVDTEGRPSLSWRVRHASRKTRRSARVARGIAAEVVKAGSDAAHHGAHEGRELVAAATDLATDASRAVVDQAVVTGAEGRRRVRKLARKRAKLAKKRAKLAKKRAKTVAVTSKRATTSAASSSRGAARKAARDVATAAAAVAASQSAQRFGTGAGRAEDAAAAYLRAASHRAKGALLDASHDAGKSAVAASRSAVSAARDALPLAG